MYKKIIKFIKDNKEILLIFFFLFIVPFFWFKNGEADLGGDSSRLYFYNPYSWLKNIASYSVSPLSGFGQEALNFFMIPFLVFLTILNKIGLDYSILVPLFDGLILSLSFISIYLIIKCLLGENNRNINRISYEWSAIIGALFFVLSPILILDWDRALISHPQIFVFPLIILFILKFLNTNKFKFIIYALLITVLFSINFGSATAPWFFAFFPLAILFLGLLYLNKKKLFLKFIILFSALFILLHAFHLLPQIISMINPGSSLSYLIFNPASKYDRGLTYFKSVAPYVKLSYSFFALPQCYLIKVWDSSFSPIIYNFGEKYIYLSLIFPLIIFASLIIAKTKDKRRDDDCLTKKGLIILPLFFLITLFLRTANIGSWGREFYESLFNLPGFSMFRSFYTKFNLVFVFFYSLLLGVSLNVILRKLKSNKIKFLIIIPVIGLIVYNSIPLISGKIVNRGIWQSENIKPSLKISSDFENVIEKIRNDSLDAKYLNLPLTGFSYQSFAGERGGAYVGPSALPILAGKNDFPGIVSFNIGNNTFFSKETLKFLEAKQYDNLQELLKLFNIKYIFYNSDNYIYDNFPNWPYDPTLKKIFPNQLSYKKLLNSLSFEERYNFSYYSVLENESFLPHFYTPQNIITSNQTIEFLPQIVSQPDYNIRSGIYLEDQNKDKFNQIQNLSAKIDNLPILEFKKVNPTKYIVRIHQAKNSFPLVFSESFHEGWKAYLVKSYKVNKVESTNMENYKILKGNEEDQASKAELADYINNGWVSTLGNGKEKEIKHKRYENGNPEKKLGIFSGAREVLDHIEKYKIDFVSKNFQGTIQNDNLSSGHFYETWFKKPLPEENHLMANGYANSWFVDLEEVKKSGKYVENSDGSIDFEMIVEFWPQRLFYLGLLISGLTLLSCFGYLGYNWRREKRKELE